MRFVLFLLVLLVLWDVAWLMAGVGQTLPWRLKTMRKDGAGPQLLDVRTPAEYALFHIPGAVNRPDAFGKNAKDLGLDPDRPVVVVCMTGHRSPFVAKRLADQGLAATNLTWGMAGWKLAGGETRSGSAQ
ncbi:Rhodanese-like protein [Solidesulfovibrio carbinoliphilus subsp. oakridgensis]|uniref:Rhodanese-like protein n=1 Tax=Solidesulfovibrio carbinoliphilus subsp. oakridgensis TaxID=694327 RepID=G7QAI1_9BACT|nr:rhodanese-like domain-containing protein [Solidesulfovibrio carbinoliphilus]EHJ48734.1 Rhodanese-like protein [Solidesulfovibrio carbinoliphilus subsp. oakridgensis]